MAGWLKRLKGIAGLSALGGAAGAVFGSMWWFATSVLGLGGVVFGHLGWTALLWAGFGAFAAGGASFLLTMLGARLTLEELSPWRMAAFGAVMGFLAPPAYMFAMTGVFWGPVLSVVSTISGVLGGALGASLVVAAKRAPDELPAVEEMPMLGRAGG